MMPSNSTACLVHCPRGVVLIKWLALMMPYDSLSKYRAAWGSSKSASFCATLLVVGKSSVPHNQKQTRQNQAVLPASESSTWAPAQLDQWGKGQNSSDSTTT